MSLWDMRGKNISITRYERDKKGPGVRLGSEFSASP